MSFAQILPLAFVMIAGPQIITSFFLATSERWAMNSFAYVAGAAISITAFVTIAYLLASSAKSASEDDRTTNKVLDWVILALLLILIARVYLTRKTSEPPTWMSKLQAAAPRFAFTLGVLLLGVFPTDILTSTTAGIHIARHDDPWWHCLPFVGLTLLLLTLPAIGVLLLGSRASVVLPKVRDWMTDNAWVVSEVVLVFFAAITINSLERCLGLRVLRGAAGNHLARHRDLSLLTASGDGTRARDVGNWWGPAFTRWDHDRHGSW